MKRPLMITLYITGFLLFISFFNAAAQNLVKNPGFEDYKGKVNRCCTPLYMSTHWNFEMNEFSKQNEDTENSHAAAVLFAEFFHYDLSSWRNRRKWKKFQAPIPRTGNGMANISLEFCSNAKRNYKSGAKIQGQLHEALVKDKLYCVRFYFYLSPRSVIKAKELAVFFYKEGEFPQNTYDDKLNLKLDPHLSLADSTLGIAGQWHSFTKVYRASGDERYFLLGTFKEGLIGINDDFTICSQNGENMENEIDRWRRFKVYELAHYFIDDVAVFPVSDVGLCQCEEESGNGLEGR